MFSYWLDFKLSENYTLSYHVSNILLHAANGWLVWSLLRHWFPKRPILCVLGTGIFLFHPLQTEGDSRLLTGWGVACECLGKYTEALALFRRAAAEADFQRALALNPNEQSADEPGRSWRGRQSVNSR